MSHSQTRTTNEEWCLPKLPVYCRRRYDDDHNDGGDVKNNLPDELIRWQVSNSTQSTDHNLSEIHPSRYRSRQGRHTARVYRYTGKSAARPRTSLARLNSCDSLITQTSSHMSYRLYSICRSAKLTLFWIGRSNCQLNAFNEIHWLTCVCGHTSCPAHDVVRICRTLSVTLLASCCLLLTPQLRR